MKKEILDKIVEAKTSGTLKFNKEVITKEVWNEIFKLQNLNMLVA